MPWQYKYPNATTEYNKYNDALKVLNACRAKIDGIVKSAIKANTGTISGSGVSGDYYDIYIGKAGDLITEVNSMRGKFSTFLSDLDKCIANTQVKVDDLYQKSQEKEWVEP